MKTRTVLLLTLAAASALPLTAHAKSPAPARAKSAPHVQAASTYQCPICHHKVGAAQARGLHYVCPVDGGKLTPVRTASLPRTH